MCVLGVCGSVGVLRGGFAVRTAYYYRNTHPGIKQSFGKWTEDQHRMFMETLKVDGCLRIALGCGAEGERDWLRCRNIIRTLDSGVCLRA